jgi:hypothetical protein
MRHIVLLITVAAMMAGMLLAAPIPALADHRDLGNVTCDDVLTNIPENPDMCIVDPDSIPTGESFQCENVMSEVAGRTGPFCVADVGLDIGYLIPLGP